MARRRGPRKEAVRLGQEIYQRDLLSQLKLTTSASTWPLTWKRGTGPSPTPPHRAGAPAGMAPGRGGHSAPGGRLPGAPQLRGRLPAQDRLIQCEVNDFYEAVVTLPLQEPAGRTRKVETVVDTGHSGFVIGFLILILPPELIDELGLAFANMGQPERGGKHVDSSRCE